MAETARGYFTRFIFRNALDGYSIFVIRQGRKATVLKGVIPDVPKYFPMEVTYEADGSDNILKALEPMTKGVNKDAARLYLMEIGFPENEAERLAKISGGNVFGLIGSENFRQVSMIYPDASRKLRCGSLTGKILQWKQQYPKVDMLYIQNYVEEFNGRESAHMKQNPADVLIDQFKMTFEEARAELGNDRGQILRAAVKLRIKTLLNEQCSKYEYNTLKAEVERMSGCLISENEFNHLLTGCGAEKSFDGVLVSTDSFRCETKIVMGLRRRESETVLFNDEEIERSVTGIEFALGITYHEAQKAAFSLLKTPGIKILTGGPGTGKTTVLKGIIAMYINKYGDKNVQLCAPTGRAAQRMSEATNHDACTIHHLISIGEPISAKLVVIDESSMVDNMLMSWILDNVPLDALIILVGDIDQLPSVGPGQVLRDLLSSGVETRRLARTFRNDGSIVENAYRIKDGNADLIEDEQFSISHPDNLLQETKEKYLEKVKGKSVFDVQILCPTHKGTAGIVAINAAIRDAINPKTKGKKSTWYGKSEFREGDKIICLNNNYEKGYYNGDIGMIKEIRERTVMLKIQDREIELEQADLSEISLAYAISIHKSQGSEFPDVIITLQKNVARNMLQKCLLFTAVSRAKRTVHIVAEDDTLEIACGNNPPEKATIFQYGGLIA